ncbi:hypothetical protein J2X19_001229 [Rhodoferax ferrireducens]|uniref:Uncharacterized protein n=1 Tax=Rhodoferax ferrireducens TaxID=192843 RepID=A0ABU2C5G8_9BURK|nr:hypothetical protein [Rhodoferax ferrireducens]MDR7376571.1 hypothetical protein [Rhodoferax ferrireducens]
MASLTPLSKGLIGLAIVGAMASAVWHLGLKEWLAEKQAPAESPSISTAPAQSQAPNMTEPQVAVPVPAVPTPPPAAPAANNAPISALTPANHAEAGRKLLASGDYAQARTHLEQAVQGGDGSAACLLGEMTIKGQGGITASQDKAAALFQLAQSRGSICFASN